MNRKSLLTFLIVTFGLAWILFTLPIIFKNGPQSNNYLLAMQVFFALAMWAPGLGAILATKLVEKQPVLKTLRLNTLGPRRFYLAAWLCPALIVFATFGVSLILGTGTLDTNLSLIRESYAKVPAGTALPDPWVVALAQSAFALTLAPFINILFTMGEELGWRGFLLPKLMPLGQWKAILLSGAIWGFWHAPTTLLHGYNFPLHPYLGILVMIGGCILLGIILSWLYLKTRSPWVAALAHGAFNAVAGIPFFFLKPGFDTALAGSPLGLAGWVSMALIIACLLWAKQLPVELPEPQPTEA
jgi:membrane protease YdiL (CAAX protease family)